MKLLDLFCCAGGAARGYQRAGFYVVGVDHKPQKRYCGDDFILGDALEVMRRLLRGERIQGQSDREYTLSDFAAFHASPPCQFASECTPPQHKAKHPNLIPETRKVLKAAGKPYVIENVENARRHLDNPLMLCGTMFGLGIWRHRYFEIKPEVFALMHPCNHEGYPVLITGTTRRAERNGGRFEHSVQQCRDASGIDWMTRKELDQAIPPAYTEFIGRQLMTALQSVAA